MVIMCIFWGQYTKKVSYIQNYVSFAQIKHDLPTFICDHGLMHKYEHLTIQ